MNFDQIIKELEKLQNPSIKSIYLNHGIKEPLFGIKISDLTKLSKRVKTDHSTILELLFSKNYDAMYFGYMICNPKLFTKNDFNKLIKYAYCKEISHYIVAPILSKNDLAIEICNKWLKSKNQYYKSAAYICWSLLIKNNKDNQKFIDDNKIIVNTLLENFNNIDLEENWTKYSMNAFLISLGQYWNEFYLQALKIAKKNQNLEVLFPSKTNCKLSNAYKKINKQK